MRPTQRGSDTISKPQFGHGGGSSRQRSWIRRPLRSSEHGVFETRRLSNDENRNHGHGPFRHRSWFFWFLVCSGGSWPSSLAFKIVLKIRLFFGCFPDLIFARLGPHLGPKMPPKSFPKAVTKATSKKQRFPTRFQKALNPQNVQKPMGF